MHTKYIYDMADLDNEKLSSHNKREDESQQRKKATQIFSNI